MQRPPATFCPFLQGECKQFACMLWTHVRGRHPQTGQDLDEYDCSLKWMPLLMIENANQSRQTKAAIESFRNITAESLSAIPVVAVPMVEKR